jgi:hypothetical protein
MPNYCDNSVKFTHKDKSKIDAFEEELNQKNEDGYALGRPFQFLRPNPEGDWDYDWSVKNWGTKWEASIIDWSRDDENSIYMFFETAWCPPIALYEYLVEEGWEIQAMYTEPGVGFCGKFTNEEGEVYFEYDLSDEDTLNEIKEYSYELYDYANLESEREWYLENNSNEG